VQRFTLQSRSESVREATGKKGPVSILLVEDNPADVTLVREALAEHGVQGELLVVADGEAAVEVIRDIEGGAVSCPDLFIVDLNIPKKPGSEVVRYMRESVKCKRAIIAILSSSDSTRDKEDARQLGVSQYIRKPLRLDEFLSLGAIFKAMLGSSAE
jgi:chemotaxis family two-component system response regulator Rcp1